MSYRCVPGAARSLRAPVLALVLLALTDPLGCPPKPVLRLSGRRISLGSATTGPTGPARTSPKSTIHSRAGSPSESRKIAAALPTAPAMMNAFPRPVRSTR